MLLISNPLLANKQVNNLPSTVLGRSLIIWIALGDKPIFLGLPILVLETKLSNLIPQYVYNHEEITK